MKSRWIPLALCTLVWVEPSFAANGPCCPELVQGPTGPTGPQGVQGPTGVSGDAEINGFFSRATETGGQVFTPSDNDPVVFSTVDVNDGNTISFTPGDSVFTINPGNSGFYAITVVLPADTDGQNSGFELRRNGVAITALTTASEPVAPVASATARYTLLINTIQFLSAGDEIEVVTDGPIGEVLDLPSPLNASITFLKLT